MPSEKKIERWCQMVSAVDSRVVFKLGMDEGVRWDTEPPYPELRLVEVEESHVRRTMLQRSIVEATEPETEDGVYLIVERLVAELEDGREVELQKYVGPVPEGQEPAHPGNVCRACEVEICDESEIVLYEGEPYHRRCMS